MGGLGWSRVGFLLGSSFWVFGVHFLTIQKRTDLASIAPLVLVLLALLFYEGFDLVFGLTLAGLVLNPHRYFVRKGVFEGLWVSNAGCFV